MKFYGIADAHGIESLLPFTFSARTETFVPDPETLSHLVLRANHNRARHAVVYYVELSPSGATEIQELVDRGKLAEALIKLKKLGKNLGLARSLIGNAKSSWDMIPNPKLDPNS